MDHVERLLALRELRAIVDVSWSLWETAWPANARNKCGRNSLGARKVVVVEQTRLSGYREKKKGNQGGLGLASKESVERRRKERWRAAVICTPVVEVFRKNTLRSRNASSQTGLALQVVHGTFAPIARISLNCACV